MFSVSQFRGLFNLYVPKMSKFVDAKNLYAIQREVSVLFQVLKTGTEKHMSTYIFATAGNLRCRADG